MQIFLLKKVNHYKNKDLGTAEAFKFFGPGRFAQVTKPPGHLPPLLYTSDIVTKAKVQATPPQCKSRSRKCGSDFTQLVCINLEKCPLP